tara:strand:+ start:612 stop:1001 length:390 start_codon:yes stop_codon:yes gene_type:complete
MNKAENIFREAFIRLKIGKPVNIPVGSKVSQNNIAKEAGKHPTALKKDRFPLLVLEIQDYLKTQELEVESIENKKALRKKRDTETRLADCKKQRDKLISICEAQANLIKQLRDELSDYQNGIVKPSQIK